MKRFAVALVVVVVLLLGAGSAQAGLITNGSFEEGNNAGIGAFITLYPGSTALAGWSVTGGSIDWIKSYWTASDGTYSLDMSGYRGGTITLANGFETVIGQLYELTFDMAGNPANGADVKVLNVSVGDASKTFTFNTAGKKLTDMGWTTQSLRFTATDTHTTLTFASGTDSAYGPALDNVDVRPVPEPTSMLLLGTGLFGLAGAARRRLRK